MNTTCGPAPRTRVVIYGMNYAPELTGVGRYTGEIGADLEGRDVWLEVVTATPHYPGWRAVSPYDAAHYAVERRPNSRITRCPILLHQPMTGMWRMLAPLSFAISSAPVAIWRILTGRPDVVLAVEPTLFSAPAALLAAKVVGARTVLHVQDLEVDAAFGVGHLKGARLAAMARWVERKVVRGFDAVVTISGQMRDRLVEKGVPAERLHIVRNWVDLRRIKPTPGANAFRAQLGLGEDKLVVLYAGSIGAKQALGVVLDAAQRVADDPRVVFVIAGDGPDKPALIARSAPNVRFLDLQPEEKLSELLNAADLHILPQIAGAADLVLPSKLGGMLASGKPCLVTADAGTELHQFLEGVAFLAPSGDAAAMARIIKAFAADPSRKAPGDGRKLAAQLSSDTALARFHELLIG